MIKIKKLLNICLLLAMGVCSCVVFAAELVHINTPEKVNYIQSQYIRSLNNTIVTKGELYFRGSHNIEQRVTFPRSQRFIIDKDNITVINDNGTHKASLREYPNVWAMIMTLNAVLTNNTSFLKKNYFIQVKENSNGWVMTLSPKSHVNSNISKIKLTGKSNQINSMLMQYKNGDWLMQKITEKRGSI